jgi:hypothetical protein
MHNAMMAFTPYDDSTKFWISLINLNFETYDARALDGDDTDVFKKRLTVNVCAYHELGIITLPDENFYWGFYFLNRVFL